MKITNPLAFAMALGEIACLSVEIIGGIQDNVGLALYSFGALFVCGVLSFCINRTMKIKETL